MKRLTILLAVLASLTACKTTNNYTTNIYIGNTCSKSVKPSDRVWQRYKDSQYNNTPIKAETVEQMQARENVSPLDSTDFAQKR